MSGDTDAATAQARRLLDGVVALTPAGVGSLALAWALTDLCREAWNSEPPRAARAADLLRALSETAMPADQAQEICGLAEWTAGIACVTRGQVAEALDCFDRAAAGLHAAGRPDPAAQSQVPKIMALSMLGRHDEAVACGVTIQRELRALGNLRAAARVSQNLGGVQLLRDHYAEAAPHFREAVVLFARLADHEHSVLADVGLADTLTAMGDFDEALRIYARVRMRAGRLGLGLQLALVDESVALLQLARGRYREALEGFESARRRFEAMAMPHYLAVAEKQLANAYLELHLLPEALGLLQASHAKFHELGLVVEDAWTLAQLGRAQALLGQGDAGAAFSAATALFAAQGNAVGQAAVALARAELALAGNDTAAALVWAEQAAAGYADTEQVDGRVRAEVLRAQALLGLGRVGEAAAIFSSTLAHARERQQTQVQVRCLTGQGLAALTQGERQAATQAFEAAIELFEDQRRALPGDDMRSAFLTDHLRPYEERLRMALEDGVADEVLVQLDRFRARALDERLAEGASAEDDAELQPLRERLNWLSRRVQRLQDEGNHPAALQEQLLQTERELLEKTRRQRLVAPSAAVHSDGEFSLPALCAALAADDAMIEYGVQGDELFACVVTRHGVTTQRALASWREVQEAVRSMRFQIDALRHGVAPVQQHLPRLTARAQARMAQLHTLLWAPLAPQLAACRRVLVVPHGVLGQVPFAALMAGREPLGQRHQLALAPSARAALRGLRRPPVPARQALALGETSRLAHTAREATFVASLFDHGLAFVDEAATQATLRANAGSADVLHLACHAQFRGDNPRFSALHLHDGPFTVDDAESLPLRACTVVLSACETGAAQAGVGDESVGLVRAFLVAGAARVVASLWPVDDAVTEAFMAGFYGALVAGQAPAAALQTAQMQTRKQAGHPYFWGAFTLHGGW